MWEAAWDSFPLKQDPQLFLATRGEDWASQGQPKGKAEIPIVTRESRRNSRKTTWLPRHALLQGIFPTRGSNPGLLHCRRILYQLSHKGSLIILIVYSILLLFSC